MFFRSQRVVVATGNAGTPAAADNPASLGGQDPVGDRLLVGSQPAAGRSWPQASGPIGVVPVRRHLYVADGTGGADRLSQWPAARCAWCGRGPTSPGLAAAPSPPELIAVSTIRTQHIGFSSRAHPGEAVGGQAGDRAGEALRRDRPDATGGQRLSSSSPRSANLRHKGRLTDDHVGGSWCPPPVARQTACDRAPEAVASGLIPVD